MKSTACQRAFRMQSPASVARARAAPDGKKPEVPEPSSLFLLAAGGFGLWRFRQARRA